LKLEHRWPFGALSTPRDKKLHAALGGVSAGFELKWVVPTGTRLRYVLDIARPFEFIAIKLDGRVHNCDRIRQRDAEKDAFCASQGWRMIRVSNARVDHDIDGTAAYVLGEIAKLRTAAA
jgi:very-short-patch-repair endonuclease